jgi:hypothetical protein
MNKIKLNIKLDNSFNDTELDNLRKNKEKEYKQKYIKYKQKYINLKY